MYIKEFGFIGLKFTVQGLRFRAQGSGAKFKCLKYIKVPKMPKVKENRVQLLAEAIFSDLAKKTKFIRLEYGR